MAIYRIGSGSSILRPFETVALLEAAKGVPAAVYWCLETLSFYTYLEAGSAYTRDGTAVLNTVDGGNTRFIARGGKYHSPSTLIQHPADSSSPALTVYGNNAGAHETLFYVKSDNSSASGYAAKFENDGVGNTILVKQFNASAVGGAVNSETYGDGCSVFMGYTYANNANPGTLKFYRRRVYGTAGQDADGLINLSWFGYNDAGTPENIEFIRISTSIIDASDSTEDGKFAISVMKDGVLTETLAVNSGQVTIAAGLGINGVAAPSQSAYSTAVADLAACLVAHGLMAAS